MTKFTDTQRLDALQAMTTRQVILRMSENGRGWRLHETLQLGGSHNVRDAIDRYLLDAAGKLLETGEELPEYD